MLKHKLLKVNDLLALLEFHFNLLQMKGKTWQQKIRPEDGIFGRVILVFA